MRPRAVVVTVTVALPLVSTSGLTVQVVAFAVTGREQIKLTCAEKPLRSETEMTLVNVAVWPALTVCVAVPVEVMEKSGGGVIVKLNGAEVPPGAASTTYTGKVPEAAPNVEKLTESWVSLTNIVGLQMNPVG